ncbi:MAG: acyl-ACP thioesterase domain-containing protein [Solirubrobacteraceae bacterium]
MSAQQEQLTEIVPPPEHGRMYNSWVKPGLADVAPSGRARLDALARWIQDVSYADMEDAGLAHLAVWVIRRMRISVAQFPRFGERFKMETFCSGLGRMWAERRVTIAPEAGGGGSVEAATLWVHLDPSGERPTPLLPEEIDTFSEAASGRRVTARLRHPRPQAGVQERRWRFRHIDCDLAGHVNNSAYFQPVEEEMLSDGAPEPERLDVEIEFRSPAHPGEKLVLSDGARRWIVGDGETNASIVMVA